MRTAMIRMTFVVAPVFLLLGVLGMKLGWKPNPDLAWSIALPLWTGAHIAYIIGGLALAVVLAVLWALARQSAGSRFERGAVDVVAVAGAIGAVAMTGQMVIDLIVGFRASERAAMREISRSIHELPGFEQFFYGFVPMLHLTAAVLLVVLLAVRRRLPVWPVVLFCAGAACIGTGSTPLMITGGVALCIALPAMTRGRADTPVETPVRMTSAVSN